MFHKNSYLKMWPSKYGFWKYCKYRFTIIEICKYIDFGNVPKSMDFLIDLKIYTFRSIDEKKGY